MPRVLCFTLEPKGTFQDGQVSQKQNNKRSPCQKPRDIKSFSLLCQELYASPPPPIDIPDTVETPLSSRTVTVVGKRLSWADALFYCRRYRWDLLTLHNQQEQSEAEQLLGRIPFPLTNYVWLGLRWYKCVSFFISYTMASLISILKESK